MGREDDFRFLRRDGCQHFVQRRRGVGGLATRLDRPGLEHRSGRRDVAHLQNLAPAITEPAVAYHQTLLAGSELPRHRFHAECAAARNHRHRLGVVDLFQGFGNVLHHALKGLRHVIERAVGVDHGILDQSLGIDARIELGHGDSFGRGVNIIGKQV
ncbi:hypothetical protein D3C72_413820 [compost metagenome]